MKLLITLIDWEYPEDGEVPKPQVWDLEDRDLIMYLYLTFANGVILEAKADGDTEDSLKLLRGIMKGAGGCVPTTLSSDEKSKLWLYEDSYECYIQGSENPGYIFVNPVPQPRKF